MKRVVLILSAALLFTSSLFSQSVEMVNAYLKNCEMGAESWRTGDYNTAFRSFELALSKELSFPSSFKESVHYRDVQSKLDALNKEILGIYDEGLALYRKRKFNEALQQFEELLKIDSTVPSLDRTMKSRLENGAIDLYIGYCYSNDAKKQNEAYSYLCSAGRKGQSTAAYDAAQMIVHHKVIKEESERRDLYLSAAQRGHETAIDSTLAICFRENRYDDAKAWFEKTDSPFSYYIRARFCLEQYKDAEAFMYAEKAYNGGNNRFDNNPAFAYLLGLLYDNGIGVEKDTKKGLELLKKGKKSFNNRD